MKSSSFLIIVAALMFSLMYSSVAAETVDPIKIISISYTKESADIEKISFVLDAERKASSFELTGDNPRLVLDFENSTYGGPKAIILKEGILLSSIRAGIHQKPVQKTRIVLDLAKDSPVKYSQYFEADSKTLIVKLEHKIVPQVEKTQDTKASSEQAAPEQTPSKAELEATPLEKKPVPPVFFFPLDKDKVVAEDKKPEQAETAKKADPKKVTDKVVIPQDSTESGDVKKKSLVERLDEKDKKKPEASSVGAELLGLSFDSSSNNSEMVLFHLNDFFPPTVSAIEVESPRILCDFFDMNLGKEVQTSLTVNGKYVERIRAGKHDNPKKVRVVLDLASDRDYDLQQVFFKNDNLFVLIINELPSEKTDEVKK